MRRSRRDEPSPKAVPRIARGIEPGGADSRFQNWTHSAARQSLPKPPMTSDHPKHRPLSDSGMCNPVTEGCHRAELIGESRDCDRAADGKLVGLRSPQPNQHALRSEREIFDIKADQL